MREIELYMMESEYAIGDSTNLDKLSKKIMIDEKVFQTIQKDYNSNNQEFELEYKNAKKNYYENLNLYYWLVLKFHFERTQLILDNKKEHYNALKKEGWMLPSSFFGRSITSLNQEETIEMPYIRHFERMFDILFDFSIGQKDSRIDRYYHQAIDSYKRKNYYSCAVSLFPIIESYHQYMNDFNKNEFYRIKENLDGIKDKIEDVYQVYSGKKFQYYIDLVEQFNDLASNHYFSVSVDRNDEPKIINRNRIMHGLFSREISSKDCLQLFCVISNLRTLKDIIDANRMLHFTEEVIKSMS